MLIVADIVIISPCIGVWLDNVIFSFIFKSVTKLKVLMNMNIEVWKQPTTSYSDNFTVEQGEAISVMVTARGYKHDSYNRAEEEPSFNVELSNPGGEKVTPELSKTVKKREVSVGMKYEPYYPGDTASEEPYHVRYTEYSKTYKVTNATGGIWTLKILPINVQDFEYTIEIGG